MACKEGQLAAARWLFARGASADLGARSASGNGPMMWAALRGHQHVMEWLVEVSGQGQGNAQGAPASLSSLVRQRNRIGATPLMAAVKEGYVGAAQFAFEQGAAPDIGAEDVFGRCPMGFACLNASGGSTTLREGGEGAGGACVSLEPACMRIF